MQLINEVGHIFLSTREGLWILDTGAPTSFGATESIELSGQLFKLDRSYMGLNSELLSSYIGKETLGIIGADILNQFDVIFDIPNGQVDFVKEEVVCSGATLFIKEFMSIPIIEIKINGQFERMFFDTGAQISYWQSKAIEEFPRLELKNDFFPMIGSFDVQTYRVACSLAGIEYSIQFGSLPGLLDMMLKVGGVTGIIGNEIMGNRKVVYSPRTSKLVLL